MSDEFRLIQEEGYSERTLAEGESLEEVLEKAGEKAGRGSILEVLDGL